MKRVPPSMRIFFGATPLADMMVRERAEAVRQEIRVAALGVNCSSCGKWGESRRVDENGLRVEIREERGNHYYGGGGRSEWCAMMDKGGRFTHQHGH